MYGKIFDSMYEGTLYGHWEAIVTLQQMLVLCNQDGVIDMTPQAIAARTSIPFDIIDKGIKTLAEPDPYSRTPDEDGRRIVLLDEHRPWGWRLVNYQKYQQIKNRQEKLEADRIRIADKRKANKTNDVAGSRKPSQTVADVAPVTVTASVSASVPKKSKPFAPSPSDSKPADSGEVVERIPLNDSSEFEVRESFVAELDRLYPAVEPKQTLREMRGWCLGNPTRRKTVRGVRAFITSWFAREQDKHSRRPS